MPEKSVFISSCSRRQLARRRPDHLTLRAELLVVMVLAAILGTAAFLVGFGGF